MKRFLRRKSSRIAAEENSNKNNAKATPTLPAIVDNEPETAPPDIDHTSTPAPERRPSATETIDSSSTQESKKKDGYLSRLAAESRESPHLSPWASMSGMSHSGVKVPPPQKPKPRMSPPVPIHLSDPGSTRASVDAISSSEAPAGDYHPGIGIAVDGISSFSNSRTSVVVPPSPTITISPVGAPYNRSSSASMPSPPMPSYPPPAPPPVGAPIGPLANPFRDEHPSPTDIGEPIANPHAVRPPPPPPPPAKIQRSPSKPSVPPPSAFIMHKRGTSGRTSPGPSGFRKVSLPSPPVPPPPPPSAPASDQRATTSEHGNSAFADVDPRPSSSQSPSSPSWDSWVPDLTGYYGGTPSFVAELDNTEASVPPGLAVTSNDERQELDPATDTQNDHLKVEEDLRETNKVLLPDGVSLRALTPEPGTNGTSSKSSEFQLPPDSVVLSNSEHNSLLAELAKLRTQLADVDKLHKASQARVAEWEAYRVSMDKYVGQITADRQTIVEKLNSSEQALAEKDRHAKQLHSSLNEWQAHAKAIDAHSQRVEADKNEKISQLNERIEQLQIERAETDRALQNLHSDTRRMQAAQEAEMTARRNSYELTQAQMASQMTHLEKLDRENKSRIVDMDGEILRLVGEVVECKKTIDEWQRQYETAANARNVVNKEMQALKAQVVNMSGEADKARARLEEAERTKAELAETKEKIERMKEEAKTMEVLQQTATEEKEKLKEKVRGFLAEKGRLMAMLDDAQRQARDRQAKIVALEKASEAQKKRMYMLGQRMAEKVEWYEGQVAPQRAAA
ncbi:hypothetical protein TWF696_003390 [Orbilia brochopaga]|uniref:Transforming acidic coiled-coil-containing protein C-terminal domain-containing protein n=1 Tax=Orbilia brochopaga TaxID=3140254 RepID=A0AAV9TXV3_9PEZI